jgi:hypothetical protein
MSRFKKVSPLYCNFYFYHTTLVKKTEDSKIHAAQQIAIYRVVAIDLVGAIIDRPPKQIACNLFGFRRKRIDYRLAAM